MRFKYLIIAFLVGVTFCYSQSIIPLQLKEVYPSGWILSQLQRDWNSGSFAYMSQNQYFPTKLGPIFSENITNKIIDKEGRTVYLWDYGEMEGNLLDASVRAAVLSKNTVLLNRYKKVLDFMLDIADTQYSDSVAYNNVSGGELFGQTCMMRGVLAYYEYTGEIKYLEAVKKIVDLTLIEWNKRFDNGETYFGRDFAKRGALNHSLAYSDILEWVYKFYPDRKYVDFAFRLYDDFNKNVVDGSGEVGDEGGNDIIIENLMDEGCKFKGHGPHTAEHLRMPLWLSIFTKDSIIDVKSKYDKAVKEIKSKTFYALSPTGGLVTDPQKHESINGKSSSGYLPYEYCSLTEILNSLASYMQKYIDLDCADMIENIFFNAAQGARFSDGKANTYLVSDNLAKAVESRNWRDQYSALHGIRCCNLNAARITPNYVANMWGKGSDDNSIISILHGPSIVETSINGVDVKIEQKANYPFENKLQYVVKTSSPIDFVFKVRIPDWTNNDRLKILADDYYLEEGFICIAKSWSDDSFAVEFDDEIQLLEVNSDDSNDFYLRRGALIYARNYDYEYTTKQIKIGNTNWPNGFYFWDIKIPDNKLSDYNDLKLLSQSGEYFKVDSSFFHFEKSSVFIPSFPYDFPVGKIIGRFCAGNSLISCELIPMGCAKTRRVTFPKVNNLSKVYPVTIELEGPRQIDSNEKVTFKAIVKNQFGTPYTSQNIVWSSDKGNISQTGEFSYNGTGIVTLKLSCGEICSYFKIMVGDITSLLSNEKVGLFVYPSVVVDNLNFSNKIRYFKLFDVYGNLVKEKFIDGENIMLNDINSGVYLVDADGSLFKILKL